MANKKPKHRWIVRGLVVLLIILLIVALLPPILINLKPIKERILADISKEIGGQVNCERLVLSLLPLPRAVIYKGSISIPGKVSGHSDSFAVYPEILPLFTGKLRLRRIQIKDPVFIYEIQKKGPVETKDKPTPLSPANVLEGLDPVMALLASKSPNLVVQVENGSMRLAMEDELVFQYQELRAQNDIPNNKMAIDIDDFTITIDGLGDLQEKKTGSVPPKTSDEGNKRLVLRGRTLKTSLTLSEDEATLSLIELNLDHPQLNLSGQATLAQASPPIRLELVGKELDIFSTREAALALAGDDPTVRVIFDYMRGGKIPLITFTSQ